MTVKELKEKITSIPEEFDNMEIITDDPYFGEECYLGDPYEKVVGLETYVTDYCGRFENEMYYMHMFT